MYAKNKGSTSVPSDAQAREKLALYVYEYLLHVGAKKAAVTFLSEIRWEKKISLGDPPGFLHSWWCVFWDLYCAAPERCDTNEHSTDAKEFHEYRAFVNAGYRLNGVPGGPPGPNTPMQGMGPPTEVIPCNGPGPGSGQGPGAASFYPNNPPMRPTQPPQPPMLQAQPPHQQIIPPQYMGPRYQAGPRPGPRMAMGNEYGGHPGHPSMMSNGSDPANRQMPGVMSQMNHRMNAPMGPMGPRGPSGPPGPGPFISMAPPGGGRPQWQPNTSSPMNNGYPSASPGNYAGAQGSAGHSGPGTPTMPSSLETGGNHGADNLYGIVKLEPTRDSGGLVERRIGGRTSSDGNSQIRCMVQNPMGSVLNNDSLANSPASGPATPREIGNGAMTDFGLAFGSQGENGQMESAAILKIKESMQEEAKRFEKDSDQSDFFMR